MNEGAALTEHTAGVQRRRSNTGEDSAAVRLAAARLSFGDRTLWEGLDLTVARGEFVAVLGPNGSGKTSLLKVLLGQVGLSSGTARIAGSPARTGNPDIGYVPQQKTIDAGVQLRGVDLVGLGVDGHRWGLGLRSRAERKRKVAAAIADVGAEHFAHAPLESMSGGEQQRLRVAQALVGDPKVLLCDEPLLSLDLANQRLVAELIDRRRRTHDTAVLFVTHEINPILPLVDRVLYLVDGRFRIGTPEEVMTSPVLSELYRTQVDVLRVRGRLVVVGTGDTMDALGTAGGHCHGPAGDEFVPGGSAQDGSTATSDANDSTTTEQVDSADPQACEQADRSSTPDVVTNGAAPAERIPAAASASAHPASSASSRTIPGNGKSSIATSSAPPVPTDLVNGNGDRSAADPDESGVRS
jgi:zinc/manganese transport system ATP-binding protein